MVEMTAEEIVKALRNSLNMKNPSQNNRSTYIQAMEHIFLIKYAANFIENQVKKIERLKAENEQLNQHGGQYMKIAKVRSELVEKYGAENEKLSFINFNLQSKIKDLEEKQMAKRINYVNEYDGKCPCCGALHTMGRITGKYCYNCGQKLLWEE